MPFRAKQVARLLKTLYVHKRNYYEALASSLDARKQDLLAYIKIFSDLTS